MTRAVQEMIEREIEERDEELPVSNTVTSPLHEIYAMPATAGQVRFWSLDQLNPGNPALNMPLMWKCSGPLNLDLLRQAFTLVVERHESLRTTFDRVNGEVMQIIGQTWAVPIPVRKLEPSATGGLSDQATRLINEHASLRMDLQSGPLLVAKLLDFGRDDRLLLVTLHHIICDGMSTGVLLRDVAAFYKALLLATKPVVPELPIQFADFAIWQQEWRGGPEHAASLEFWRKSLGTNFDRIELNHDESIDPKTLPENSKQTGDIETLLLTPALAVRVQDFCRANSITPNVFFFSVFSLLLNHVTGQRDLLIGSPCANRNMETENLIGMFMNIQAMRLKLLPGETFKTVLDDVQEWTIQAYENQQLPFEDLIYDQHFLSGEGAFELPVFFLYQRSFMVTHQIGDLTIVPLRSMSPGAAFEIMFAVVDREGEGPRLQLEYNPIKFRRSTIRQYLDLYNTLIESALEDVLTPLENMYVGLVPLPTTANSRSREVGIPSQQKPGPTAIASLRPTTGTSVQERRNFRDPIDFQLVEIWQATLGIPDISVDDGYFSLGVSSLSALRLVTRMNRVFSTDLGLASLFAAPSIRAIADMIRKRLSPNMQSSLVPIHTGGTKPPLFIVHGVRGNVLSFYGLAMRLGKDQPVYGIQAQALVSGQPALLRLPDMAAYYIAEMRTVQPEGPYNLLGYSFGGIVVMEMAHQLKASGHQVSLLGMLDSKSPDYMDALKRLRAVKGRADQEEVRVTDEALVSSSSEKVQLIFGRLRARVIRLASQIALKFNIRTLPSSMKDAWNINYVAALNYKIHKYDGYMTLFRASRQAIPDAPADLGWGPLFADGVDVRELPGTHETLWAEQNIEAFAVSLCDSLQAESTIKQRA